MRIVSLLPSATEIVCQIGLGDQLVGVTHECDYPTSVLALPKVTKTLIPHDATSQEIDGLVRERLKSEAALYSLDMPMLQRLRPELIVTQALCDVCAVAESEVAAAARSLPGHPQVINLEPSSLEEVFQTMQLVGDAAGVPDQAFSAIAELRDRVKQVESRTRALAARPTVVILEWIDPPFSSGHWSPELVRLAGGVELLESQANGPAQSPGTRLSRQIPSTWSLPAAASTLSERVKIYRSLQAILDSNIYRASNQNMYTWSTETPISVALDRGLSRASRFSLTSLTLLSIRCPVPNFKPFESLDHAV